jgi:predicted ATPase/class 3 adenylate cyclase
LPRADLPSGTVTFLFTDVEGSTRLLHELGAEAYANALAEHRRLIREACAREGGVEVDTQGDAFFFAFPTAQGALEAARAVTEALSDGSVQVRVGLHTGAPLLTEEGYVGDDVHFAARVAASSHGGQVVLSQATARAVRASDSEPQALPLLDLGEHRLKDVSQAVPIFQLGEESFPPLKTISNTNLPRPASSFVGRDTELAEVLSRIEGGARLLTLTGPGGSGKTRLALEAAATLVPEYKAGVFWVGLAALRDPALVTETIAQTLGAKYGLAEHIAERELLLLLDNLEQVVQAAPDLASLLESCPNLALLVTSRELLRVRGEVEYPVPPLASPEALALFCERAQLDPSEAISELCARLDNLPLAVELAAARTKALTPVQILERLSQRLDLLKGGRDADPRQQTLRATIEWSYDLLSEEEQRLFVALSVFAGGCTLEAAEDVAGADVETLQSLVEKSLLRFSEGRYWMLETIREYAGERLDPLQRDDLVRALAAHFVEMARRDGAPTFLGRQAEAYARFDHEFPNMRTVASWAHGASRYEVVWALTAELWAAWINHGHASEALGWIEQTPLTAERASDRVRIAALLGAGEIARFAGRLTWAKELKLRLLDLVEASDRPEPWWETGTLADLADIALEEGDLQAARQYADRSLELRRTRGLSPARALSSSGDIALFEGNLLRAERELRAAEEEYRHRRDDANYAAVVLALGEVYRRQRRYEQAARHFAEALRRFAALGDGGGVGDSLLDLAVLAGDLGNPSRARVLWHTGHELLDEHHSRPTRARRLDLRDEPGTAPL